VTFSIVACDLEEQSWGVAVASKFPAVGAVVPWAQARVGAVATQSFANTSFGPRGLALMGTGLSAHETLDWLFCLGRRCFRKWVCHTGQYSRKWECRLCDGKDFLGNQGNLASPPAYSV